MNPHFFVSSDGSLYDTRRPDWSARPLRTNFSRTFARINSGLEFRATLRAGGYVWPGGYALQFLTDDSEYMCFNCARENARQILRSIRDRTNDGWRIVGCAVYWEGEATFCANCQCLIPSTYGECDE